MSKQLFLVLLLAGSALADKNGVSPSRLKLPKGPGSIEGVGENVEPNLSMGLMTYGVPIQLPQGYEGMTPSLRLSYSSGNGSGEVGIGWSLSVPSIERMTVRGLPGYVQNDAFASGGSDELVRLPGSNTYRARFEGAFIRYTWIDPANDGRRGYWKAEYPDGRVGYFGAYANGAIEPNARVENPTSGGTFKYFLVEMVDVFTHTATYQYIKDGAWPLLSAVTYVFEGASQLPRYRVDLAWEPRPDELSDCKPGFDLRLTKRLSGVKASVRGNQLRRYQLTYASPTATAGISRLQRVQQYGTNDLDGPYPIDFTFTYSDALNTNCTGQMCNTPQVVAMGGPLGLDLNNGTADLIDLNGDGLPDVFDTQGANHRIFVNELTGSGHRFRAAQTSTASAFALNQPGVQPVDLNGDGFTDLVDGVSQSVLWNRGSGDWQAAQSLGSLNLPNFATDVNLRFFDFNQDKRIDVIHSDSSNTWVYENTGTGYVQRVAGIDALGVGFAEGLQLADMNGDGMLDAVRVAQELISYKVNLGGGRFEAAWRDMSLDPSILPAQVRLNDINGDGLSDVVTVVADSVSWSLNQNGRTLAPAATIRASAMLNFPTALGLAVRFADMNANGSTDVVWFDSSGQVTYLDLFPNRPNLLTRVVSGIGKTIDIAYGSSTSHRIRDASSSPWKYSLPHPMLTVDRIETGEPVSSERLVQEFHYSSGFYDGKEKQFRGFANVEVKTNAGASVEPGRSLYDFDVGQPMSLSTEADPYRKGLILTQTVESAGRVLSESRNVYGECLVDGVPATGLTQPIKYVCQQSTETTIQEGRPAAEWVVTRERYEYDGYGNRQKTSKFGIVSIGGTSCGPCKFGPEVFGHVCEADCHGDEAFEETDFIAPGTATNARWILRKSWRTRSYGVAGGPTKESITYYDGPDFMGLAQGTLTRGLVSRVSALKDSTGARVEPQRFRYGVHGEVLETKDANGHRRAFTYDAAGLLLSDEEVIFDDPGRVPYALRMHAEYEPTLETVNLSTQWMRFEGGANKSQLRATTYSYDGFGRLTAVVKPGDSKEYPTEEYYYDLRTPLSRIIRKGRTETGGPAVLEEVQCFDGKGRKLQTLVRIDESSVQADGWKRINGLDKDAQVSQPFRTTSTACVAAPVAVRNSAVTYDATGRSLRTTHDDADEHNGVASFVESRFLPLRDEQWDEEDTAVGGAHASTPTTTVMDGLGRRTRIERFLNRGAPVVPLSLTYDSLGHLSGYVDVKGNQKVQTYDLLGRVIRVVDPDSGTTRFVYDDAGNETESADARGVSHRKAYDEANRLVAEWDGANAVQQRLEYQYDATPSVCEALDCTFGEGQLARVTYPLDAAGPSVRGEDVFGYTARGLPAFQRRTLEGHVFPLRTVYDASDRVIRREYPAGASVTFTLDGAARMAAIPSYVSSVSYDERGQMQTMQLANGVSSTRTYDARLRLKTIKATGPSGMLQDELISYDRAGNVVGHSMDGPGGMLAREKSAFGYDEGFRLVSARVARPGEAEELLSYAYDDIDNIASKLSSRGDASTEHVGTYNYGQNGAGPHAVTTAGSFVVTYDPSGFMKTRNDLALFWDFRGNLTSTERTGKSQARYSTGPGFQRVTRYEGASVSHYIAPDFEARDGVGTIFVQVGGSRVARVEIAESATAYFGDWAPRDVRGPIPDGRVSAGDAWVLRQGELGLLDVPPQANSVDSVLLTSCRRLLGPGLGTEVTWLLNDSRGTTIATLSESASPAWADGRHVYGSEWSANLAGERAEYSFQGKEEDSNGFQYFGARYYDPRIARWVSADPKFAILGASTNTGQLGRYSFSKHAPFGNIDPDGREAKLSVFGFEYVNNANEFTFMTPAGGVSTKFDEATGTASISGSINCGLWGVALEHTTTAGKTSLKADLTLEGVTLTAKRTESANGRVGLELQMGVDFEKKASFGPIDVKQKIVVGGGVRMGWGGGVENSTELFVKSGAQTSFEAGKVAGFKDSVAKLSFGGDVEYGLAFSPSGRIDFNASSGGDSSSVNVLGGQSQTNAGQAALP